MMRSASTPRATAGFCLAAAVTLLSACGAGASAGPDSVVTVTITPTVTAGAARPTSTAAPTTRSTTVKSDVMGRNFDLGTIVRVQNDNGVPVVIFDRWTVLGVSDSALAVQGIPMHVHSDAPYQNHNNRITYRIPVAQKAVFTYRHCVSVDQPPMQKSSNLNEFVRLASSENVVLLMLDPRGQVVKAENDPAC